MNTVASKQSKLPSYISLLLVIALGISLAKLMWLLLTPLPKLDTQVGSLPASNAQSTQKIQKNYGKVIANQHLFGSIAKKPVKIAEPIAPVTQQKVVATRLNLKLHGIVAYTNKAGYALISSSGGSQKVYGKGDEIQEQVTVTEVLPSKVILDNHGKIEELLLPRKTAKKSANNVSSLLPDIARPHSRRRSSSTSLPNGLDDIPPPPSNNELASFRQEVINNPAKLMDIATTTPATENGQLIGYRVRPGSNRQIFRKIGLRTNDIITSVNGIPLDDVSQGPMALSELSLASDVSITVKRGKNELTLQHSF